MLSPALLPERITADLAAMDRLIRQRLHSEAALVGTVAQYLIAAGGKRLRPVLLLLFARALADETHNPTSQQPILLAAVVEFIHTATLLHDDVVDESTLRRGRATAHAAFGNPAAVLVGDFLYSRAFQMMVETQRMDVMHQLAESTNTIAEGEVLQLMHCHDPTIDEARYLKVIQFKTARLFEAAARVGAMLVNSPTSWQDAAAQYGRKMGTAFQLIDDVLDYSGVPDEIGKNVGDDLREGKITLPLIHVLQHGSPAQRQAVQAAIQDGQAADFATIMTAIHETHALQYTRARAQAEAQSARATLTILPDSAYRTALEQMADQAAQRTH